jgi:hypothetical protein
MNLLHDYFYRFPREYLQIPGRCRVRIYKRKNGAHTVVLTELNNNSGESITSACARIATDLALTKVLNPKTTRWIQHEPHHENMTNGNGSHVFHEVQFTWNSHKTARDPQWLPLEDAQVEELTSDSLPSLIQVMGDKDPHALARNVIESHLEE